MSPLDLAEAGYDAVRWGLFVGDRGNGCVDMVGQLPKFFKAIAIEQKVDPLPRRQFALIVLPFNALGATKLK